MAFPPERIVCLTEETVETLYLLGQSHRIVGVTGYAVRPPQVRREKPRVGAFTSADVPKILDLKPDLVLTFSDLQADIAADLIREGIAVHAFNQRSVAEILNMIRTLGALTDCAEAAHALADGYAARLEQLRAVQRKTRPRVYFEEWDDPPISGIAWVSELIEIAGGTDVFAQLRSEQGARSRILDPQAVIDAVGTLLTNKYAEGYPGRRYYGGCQYVDEVENLAIDRAKQLFDCEFANVQPHSGSQANQAVMLALIKPGDTIIAPPASVGGHVTHHEAGAAGLPFRRRDCAPDQRRVAPRWPCRP